MEIERKSRTSVKKKLHNSNIYLKSILKKKISIPIQYIGSTIHSLIEDYLKQNFENKCIEEGFIKAKTINLLSHTSGICEGDKVLFDTVFECLMCNVSEGTSILCNVKNISKAGLRCELNESPSPLVIFVARDHHLNNELYNKIEQENQIKVNIIGSMFELNDTFISAIGTLEEIKTK